MKFMDAKSYCYSPFEVKHVNGRKLKVFITNEWIGDHRDQLDARRRNVEILCANSMQKSLEPASLDGVFTDPPYWGNVQYAELMDFCYMWLRRLLGNGIRAFQAPSTRNQDELTGNENMGRDINHFTEGLSAVFRKMALALKPGGSP